VTPEQPWNTLDRRSYPSQVSLSTDENHNPSDDECGSTSILFWTSLSYLGRVSSGSTDSRVQHLSDDDSLDESG